MDYFSFIIGLLFGFLGISNKNIMNIIRTLTSAFTSYLLLSINNKMYLWNLSDYNNKNIINFFNSKIFNSAILFFILSFLFFYILIPYLLEKIIKGKIVTLIEKKFSNQNKNIGEKIIKSSVKIVYKILVITRIGIPTKKLERKEITYNEISKYMIDLFSLVFHLTICICFYLSFVYAFVSLLILLFFVINLFFIPIWLYHSKYYIKCIIDENNRYVEKFQN